MRAYVLGNENCILGFSQVGIAGQLILNAQELGEALDRALADEEIGMLLVSADVVDPSLRERLDQLKVSSLRPLVVEIPGAQGETPYASLQELVQGAVGISLGDKT